VQHIVAVINISNMQGQLIISHSIKADRTNIDVSAFSKGVYIVEVRTDKVVTVKKFVKE